MKVSEDDNAITIGILNNGKHNYIRGLNGFAPAEFLLAHCSPNSLLRPVKATVYFPEWTRSSERRTNNSGFDEDFLLLKNLFDASFIWQKLRIFAFVPPLDNSLMCISSATTWIYIFNVLKMK